MLFAVVAPFFTTYLIRTIAWKTILSDESPFVSFLKFLHIVPQDGHVPGNPGPRSSRAPSPTTSCPS